MSGMYRTVVVSMADGDFYAMICHLRISRGFYGEILSASAHSDVDSGNRISLVIANDMPSLEAVRLDDGTRQSDGTPNHTLSAELTRTVELLQ